MSAFGLILAGGQGERLGGVRKRDLKIRGRTLLERVGAALRDLQPPLRLSLHDAAPVTTGYKGLIDDPSLGGPMAGLAAALDDLADQPDDAILVTVAVDTPFLPPDYAHRLIAALDDTTCLAAFAGWRAQSYPTNTAFRLGALRARPLPDRPIRLLEQLGARRIAWDEQAENPFSNLNTLADLVALQRRARAQPR